MNDYANKHLFPEARITILQLLDNSPDGLSNALMLVQLLKATTTQLWLDQVIEQLRWLEGEGLVKVTETSGLVMAEITRLGAATARGEARHDEIARPRPEA